jgi:hypothetical protein
VSEEAAELVSLITIVGGTDVSVIGDHEVVLSLLVLQVRDRGSKAILGHLGQGSRSQEFFILLILKHSLELRSHGHAHLADFTLVQND